MSHWVLEPINCTQMDHTENALHALQEKLGSRIKTSPEILYAVSYDGLKISGNPQALIEIEDHHEVGEVLKLANQFSIPVTSRGTGSSLTGGATPYYGGWVLDLSRLAKLEVDPTNMLVRCGPGVVVGDCRLRWMSLVSFTRLIPLLKTFVQLEEILRVMPEV